MYWEVKESSASSVTHSTVYCAFFPLSDLIAFDYVLWAPWARVTRSFPSRPWTRVCWIGWRSSQSGRSSLASPTMLPWVNHESCLSHRIPVWWGDGWARSFWGSLPLPPFQCCRDEVPQSGTTSGKARVACMSESCTYLHGGLQRADPVSILYLWCSLDLMGDCEWVELLLFTQQQKLVGNTSKLLCQWGYNHFPSDYSSL